ncbi:MAG: AMP-binding protein [Spirochaetia bacterium]|jgi:long-chain acyl-CoA synthetase|nr:AMP-binding protein [Spirochaetia bacterium]
MEESLVALINDAASTWPFGPYVLGKTDSGWKAHSFSQTRDRARAFAAWLLHRGFSPGQKGAILGEGSPEWVQGEFGLLTAGLVSVPLSAKLTGQELSYRLVHSESAILLVSSNLFDRAVAALAESAAEKAHAGLDKDSPRDFGAGKAPPCISDSHAPILVCLDSGQSRERLGEKMEAAGFGSENLFFFSQAAEAGEAALRDSPEAAIRLDSIATEMRADSLAFICYTSGTSDNPKAVMLSHRNIRANSHDAFVQFHTPRYKTLIVLPADHAFIHTVAIFTALWCGVALYFLDSRGGTMAGIRNIAGNIQECQPDFMLTVPALSANIQKRIIAGVRARGPLISRLFEAGIKAEIEGLGDGYNRPTLAARLATLPAALVARLFVFPSIRKKAFGSRIKFCVSGGARSGAPQELFFTALGIPFLAGYGLTEASPIVSANVLGCAKFGTVGRPMPSVRVAILDEEGNSLPPGRPGEIAVSGDSVMLGYYKNPDDTNRVLSGGWLRTGDLGFLDEDGFLSVQGRIRSLLISDTGEKYSPEAIEETILSSTELIEQIMVWCDHKKFSCALVALDVDKLKTFAVGKGLNEARDILQALIREFFAFRANPGAKHLQNAWTPATFQILPEAFSEKNGTLNSTLKIVRYKAAQAYGDLLDYSYTPEGSNADNPRNLKTIALLLEKT